MREARSSSDMAVELESFGSLYSLFTVRPQERLLVGGREKVRGAFP